MSQAQFRFFLILLAIGSSLLVALATSSYGPGLSTDGARYLSTAENMAAGRGMIDYLGLPLTSWPPLYPIILAALSLLLRADVFIAGQILNILCFGIVVYLGGIFFERSLNNQGLAAAAVLLLASSLPLIEVSANIASDPLFAVCLVAFLLRSQSYLQDRRRVDWWLMVGLAITATFLRYAGLLFVFSGTLLVLAAWRSNWRSAFGHTAAFGLAAGLPPAAWALFYNLPRSGLLLGAHRPAEPVTNFLLLFEKMAGWFVPVSWANGPAALLAFCLLLAAWLWIGRGKLKPWLAQLQSPQVLPSLVVFLVYSAILVFTISTSEHRVPGSQRLHVLLLPMFLVLALTATQTLWPTAPRRWLLAGLALLLLLPAYRAQAYVRNSLREGDVSYYNLYNTRTLRESDIVAFLATGQLAPYQKIYSNNEAAAWFYLRERIYRLPRFDVDLNEDADRAIRDFEGWPAQDELAALIWFERDLDYKEQVPRPEQIEAHLALAPLFIGRYGDVYLMRPE